MKLMAIVGSPRKGSSTELLVDQIIVGSKSKTEVDVEKFFVIDKKIEYCDGCLRCTFPPPGTGKCVIEDEMAEILERMKKSDAFIFATPNHMQTITAPLLNFLSRMLPLWVFKDRYDDKGNRVGGETTSKIKGKKVAIVISQGEHFFCSSLVHELLTKNLRSFELEIVGNIISMGNLYQADVARRERDLKMAFDLGAHLATMTCELQVKS